MKKLIIALSIAIFSFAYVHGSVINEIDMSDEKPKIEYININIPSTIQIYDGDNFQIGIQANNEYIQKNIRYKISNSMLKIWIDNMNIEEICNLNSEDIRIKIIAPNGLRITANSNLSVTRYPAKKKFVTDYGKN